MSITPPRASNALLAPGTPIHTRSSTTGLLEKEHVTRDKIYQALSAEIPPFFLGPMPPDEFLSTFLPSSKPSSFKLGMFDKLSCTEDEAQMYPIFVAAVQEHLKRLRVRVTAGKNDIAVTNYNVSFSPDCTVYAEEHQHVTVVNSHISDIYIEFKYKQEDDPFLTFFDPTLQSHSNPLMRKNTKGRKTASQIAIYAALQLDSQYRTHVFSVLILRDYARLIRWDRSGAIVTGPINFTNGSALLDFFTRYDQAKRSVRGHDDTVRKASLDETNKACLKDNHFNDQELLVVTIPRVGKQCLGNYVITPPKARPRMLFGRATRTSLAYDIEDERLVFFKDSWRVDLEGMSKEGDIYVELNNAKIPDIPHCSAFGDVEGHTTHTHQYVNATWVPRSTLFQVENAFTRHTHHRVILDDIGRRLETFGSSKGLVMAILAALKAHEAAYRRCGILHRDISSNNILLTTNKTGDGGLLIDWDLCKKIDKNNESSGGARQFTRTGTWRFMAADIVENPKIHQTFIHDIESTFFVLLWMAINYVKSNWSDAQRSSALNTIFDQPVYGDSGGTCKSSFMRSSYAADLPKLLDNAPLTGLLINLRSLLSFRHWPKPVIMAWESSKEFTKRLSEYEAKFPEEAMKNLENHDAAISCFERFIEYSGWPSEDCAEQQAVVLSRAERYDLLSSSKRCRDAAPEGEFDNAGGQSRKRANLKSSPSDSR